MKQNYKDDSKNLVDLEEIAKKIIKSYTEEEKQDPNISATQQQQ